MDGQHISGKQALLDGAIPVTPGQITPGWINEVLFNGKDEVRSIELQPVQEGYGIIGVFSQVKLRYGAQLPAGPENVFAKFSSDNEISRFLSKREVRFFQDLAHLCSVRTPACYFASATQDDECVLLLEYFTQGRSGDSTRGCTRDEAELLFLKAAELHAQWWEHPALRGLEWVDRFSRAEVSELQNEVRNALPKFRESFGSMVPGWALQLAEKGLDLLPEIFQRLASGPATLVHGDMQLDNVWFGLRDTSIALFDWQLSQRAQPGWDIAWFFNHSYPLERRRQDEDYLLNAYLTRLHELGVDDYSLAALREYVALSSLLMIVLKPADVAGLDYGSERAKQSLLLSIRRCVSTLEDYGAGDLL
jgi:hypothetical protein